MHGWLHSLSLLKTVQSLILENGALSLSPSLIKVIPVGISSRGILEFDKLTAETVHHNSTCGQPDPRLPAVRSWLAVGGQGRFICGERCKLFTYVAVRTEARFKGRLTVDKAEYET